jgi:hypothetical protein
MCECTDVRTLHSWLSLLVLGGISLVGTRSVAADDRICCGVEPEIPKHRIMNTGYVAARVNPLGLFLQPNLQYRYRFYKGEGALLRDNYLAVGLVPTVSPAFGRIGGQVDVQPVAALRFTGAYERGYYFGSFNLFQSFPGAGANFSDTTIVDNGDNGRNYKTTFTQATLGGLLQLRVGPVVVRNNFRAVHFNADLRAGDTTFYDQFFDVLVPNDAWVLFNDADAMYEIKPGFLVGVRYHVASPRYKDRHFAPGDDINVDNSIQRLGLFAAYRLSEEDGSKFHTPTILASTQWHLEHRWRTGADVSQALPLVFVGLMWSGDLWSKK